MPSSVSAIVGDRPVAHLATPVWVSVRAVADTNVFVAGVFFVGAPREVLSAWRDGRIELVVSREIIAEYTRIGERLSRPFPDVDFGSSLNRVARAQVPAPPLPEPVCTDPDDDKFLACAVAAGAAYVVSSDRALLATSPYRDVVVMRPRDFMDMLGDG